MRSHCQEASSWACGSHSCLLSQIRAAKHILQVSEQILNLQLSQENENSLLWFMLSLKSYTIKLTNTNSASERKKDGENRYSAIHVYGRASSMANSYNDTQFKSNSFF